MVAKLPRQGAMVLQKAALLTPLAAGAKKTSLDQTLHLEPEMEAGLGYMMCLAGMSAFATHFVVGISERHEVCLENHP